MKSTSFCEARFTLYDIFLPKTILKLWKSRGLKRVTPSRFSIIYHYFMDFCFCFYIHVFCLPPLFSRLCCLKIAYCLFELYGRHWNCLHNNHFKPHLFIFMNLKYCTFFSWNEHLCSRDSWRKYQLHIFHVMHIFL